VCILHKYLEDRTTTDIRRTYIATVTVLTLGHGRLCASHCVQCCIHLWPYVSFVVCIVRLLKCHIRGTLMKQNNQ
jgi:hypothetical protein